MLVAVSGGVQTSLRRTAERRRDQPLFFRDVPFISGRVLKPAPASAALVKSDLNTEYTSHAHAWHTENR